jgi:hypothetical protein
MAANNTLLYQQQKDFELCSHVHKSLYTLNINAKTFFAIWRRQRSPGNYYWEIVNAIADQCDTLAAVSMHVLGIIDKKDVIRKLLNPDTEYTNTQKSLKPFIAIGWISEADVDMLVASMKPVTGRPQNLK